jgi:hypothetical protein
MSSRSKHPPFSTQCTRAKNQGRECRDGWLSSDKSSVFDVNAEYDRKLKDFMAWLDRRGNRPSDVIDRKNIRAILAISGFR